MFAVVTSGGKTVGLFSSIRKAQIVALRKGQRKGRTFNVVPWKA